MSRKVPSSVPVEYPSWDGRPMAENDWQLHAMIDAITVLDRYFEDRPDAYVSGDLLICYEEGNPKARAAPDVFVVFGVPKRKRPIYKLWEEGQVPSFVLEVASRGTWREDEGPKARLYERLGVRAGIESVSLPALRSPASTPCLHERAWRPARASPVRPAIRKEVPCGITRSCFWSTRTRASRFARWWIATGPSSSRTEVISIGSRTGADASSPIPSRRCTRRTTC